MLPKRNQCKLRNCNVIMKLDTRTLEATIANRSLTYKQTANAAGITERTLQQARAGYEIRTDTVGKIAAALGVDVETIIK